MSSQGGSEIDVDSWMGCAACLTLLVPVLGLAALVIAAIVGVWGLRVLGVLLGF